MIELWSLFGIALLGSIVWFVPVSATAVVYGSELGWHPLLVGAVCALAQCAGYVVLYVGGEGLLSRWPALSRRVDHARQRHPGRLESAALPTTFMGALTGVPPMVALAVLAPAVEAPLAPFLAVSFVGRLVRYAVLAGAGTGLRWLTGH